MRGKMRMKKTRTIIAWIGMCILLSLVLSCTKSHTVSGVWRFDDGREMAAALKIQGHKPDKYCMTMNEKAKEARVYFLDFKQKEGYRFSLRKLEQYRYALVDKIQRAFWIGMLSDARMYAMFSDIRHIEIDDYDGIYYQDSRGKESEVLNRCLNTRP